MLAVKEDFQDLKEIKKRWGYQYPWGTGDHKLGIYSKYKNIWIEKDGLHMCCSKNLEYDFLMARLFWKGAPMGYGRYAAKITVPPQKSVNTFTIYSAAHYMKAVRTILPEIDVVEYGVKFDQDKLNVAVHQWIRNPSFRNSPLYQDIVRRHELDYVGHKQKNNQFEWNGLVHEHSCEITPRRCRIFLDGMLMLSVRGRYYPAFNPTFGQTLPNWQMFPTFKPIIIHSFTFEQ